MPAWYGNTGTPPPPLFEVEVVIGVVLDVTDVITAELDEEVAAVVEVEPVATAVDEVDIELLLWALVELAVFELLEVVVVVLDDDEASDITDMVALPLFATNTSSFAESYATPIGSIPTVTFSTTLFLLSDITAVLFAI